MAQIRLAGLIEQMIRRFCLASLACLQLESAPKDGRD